jgi:hypothetical protein
LHERGLAYLPGACHDLDEAARFGEAGSEHAGGIPSED